MRPSDEALEANDAQRQRLREVIARAGQGGLHQVVHDELDHRGQVAHLAYWDRFALAVLERWIRGEEYFTDELPAFYDDALNDSLLAESLALPPSAAARLAEAAADRIDGRLRSLPGEVADRLLTDGDAARLLRRHRHRAEHLDEIERVLRGRLG